ncbi:hypothetical protein HY489_05505 [Candidatus Woesearchaeota archaeon]|nr:hypothetical protein [Candidatus Woesearchaeota archaeon]
MPSYYTPMDRAYHQAITEAPPDAALEDPILPINQLGETVPESNQQGRNIVQTTQAAIRGGAGTLQIVMTTSHQAAIGGRFKAMGKEVREALREVALANKVKIQGVELPTSLKNLSGFDYQQNFFSEEARREGLEEVKDAIKFTGDVMGGGGVDIVSWEFPRTVNDAKWNDDGKGNQIFDRAATDEKYAQLIDTRSGRVQRISKEEAIYLPYDKEKFAPVVIAEGEELSLEKLEKLSQKFTWNDFLGWAKHNKEENEKRKGQKDYKPEPETPEEIYAKVQLESQAKQTEGAATRDIDFAESEQNRIKIFEKALKDKQDPETGQDLTDDQVKQIQRKKDDAVSKYKYYIEAYYANLQNARDIKERVKNLVPIQKFGLQKSAQTYAEAGIVAMRETETGIEKGTVTKPLYVGPEIGWPDYYGSHPTEFVDLIESARKQMVKLLTDKEAYGKDAEGKVITNQFFDKRLDKEEAEKKAAEHVKGLFDTSHMGMWLAHFKPQVDPETKTQETEQKRLERFNKWYTERVKEIAELTKKKGLVGGIQLVDSASAAHGHLPPGQGIFPVIETAKIFKDAGYKGFLVSEGHEEERFGVDRIRTKTWQKAGANIGDKYYSGAPPLRWRQVEHNYFGRTYSPLFMFGSYSPSNEFKLWSEVPLE